MRRRNRMHNKTTCFSVLALNVFLISIIASPKILLGRPDEVKKFDLIVRTEITIDAPASAVWPYLFKAQEWKQSIGKLERVAGKAMTEGETLRVTPKGAGEDQGYYIKYVRVVENRQLVIKIFNIPDDGAVGFSDFSLFESHGKTHMIYDVYIEYSLKGMSDEEVKKFGQQAYEGTKNKLEIENTKLKELVEAQK
jgi:hypothetical protein